MDKITHEMRLIQWAPIIQNCHSSGMTIRSWCRENSVNVNQFHYWQRRIRGEVYESLKITEPQKQPKFVQLPVQVDSLRNTTTFKADMVIHIGNNVLELSNSVSEELMSNVLKVMSDVK